MEKKFEKAVRDKVRFGTVRGSMSVEDLWDVDLTSSDNFSLDDIAKSIFKDLKDSKEESFVETSTTGNELMELKLEIVKHVIKVKKEEIETKKDAANKREKKAQLLEILSRKQDNKLEEMSEKEIQKMIDSL